jgi:serine phosphatase RsbU (regulator of sigma subunit)
MEISKLPGLPALILLFIFFIAINCIVLYYVFRKQLVKKLYSIQIQKIDLEKSLNTLKAETQTQKAEKENLESEKKKAEEKNLKIREMSEAVYSEKRKVDEQVELLKIEKEKVQSEKDKVDEKLKKLWEATSVLQKEKEQISIVKNEIEIKHKEVIDSVTYAKRIQEAILPTRQEILSRLPESFVLFQPKNIVSGDFYWFYEKDDEVIIASVDCTGHGVPGAFMSMIGYTILNEIVKEKGIIRPDQILNLLNTEVNISLRQTKEGSESRDGMDIAICTINQSKKEILFAGANRPLYLIKNGELVEIKPDKFPIGGLDYSGAKKFTMHTIPFEKQDTIYLNSDGFADQFSQDNKKLMTKNFKNLLVSIKDKTMKEQHLFLDNFIHNWKGNTEQTDDILVIGIRL